MPLGTEVDLDPDDIVLDGKPLPPKRGGAAPPIFAHVLWRYGCMDQEATWYGVGSAQDTLCYMGTQHSSPPPIFGPCLLWPNGWMDQDATWYGGRPRPMRHCVRLGIHLPHKTGHSTPTFRPMSIVVKRLEWMDEGTTWYGGRSRSRPHCVRWGPAFPPERGTVAASPRLFGPCLFWPNGRPSQLLSCCYCYYYRTHPWDEAIIGSGDDNGNKWSK